MVKFGRITTEEARERRKYQELVRKLTPRSNVPRQCIAAFLVGGAICLLGQLIGDLLTIAFSLPESARSSYTSVILIFIGALLTGVGVYDRIGVFAGAGSVVPITGFANSIVAPAMEHKREGLVLGVGAQLFSFAGPVLVYGITCSVIIGVITWLFSL